MAGYSGFHPIKIWCHGIAFGQDTKIEMRLLVSPRKVGEYKIFDRKPGDQKPRTGWNFAPENVKDAAPANIVSLSHQRQLNSSLVNETSFLAQSKTSLSMVLSHRQKPGRKRPRVGPCMAKRSWTNERIQQNVNMWDGKYTALNASSMVCLSLEH